MVGERSVDGLDYELDGVFESDVELDCVFDYGSDVELDYSFDCGSDVGLEYLFEYALVDA